jgi:hypothetical protein
MAKIKLKTNWRISGTVHQAGATVDVDDKLLADMTNQFKNEPHLIFWEVESGKPVKEKDNG